MDVTYTIQGDWLADPSGCGQVVLTRIARRLHESRTPFQKAEVVETGTFGRTLVLDDVLQSCAADEFVYHESLVHPAMLASPHPRRVAILGGGEGASLREVLRHRTVEAVTMIDIDREVVSFCAEFMPSLSDGAFDDHRARLVYEDARAWIAAQAPGSLDMVVSDISEPLEGGPACLLFTREFYDLVRRALTPDGVLVTQAGPATLRGSEMLARVFASTEGLFARTHILTTYVESFSDQWGFVLACQGEARLPEPGEVDGLCTERIQGDLRHYDGQTQAHMVALPRWVRSLLKSPSEPYTDANPPAQRFESV